jgi:hypothetical protein
MSATSNNGPLITLAAVALVGAGLLVADAVTDPVRTRAETPTAAASTTAPAATPAAATTSTTTASPTPATTTGTTTSAPPTAAAYLSTAVYVGRDAARRTSVAIAVKEGKVAAYVCDGKSVESWLTGTAVGTTATLTGGSDRLLAELVTGELRVTGTVRGRPVEVTATLASAPAGLYRVSSGGTTIGWIVQPDGTQVGLQTNGTEVVPAPELVPSQPVTVDGQPAYPKEVSGDDRF